MDLKNTTDKSQNGNAIVLIMVAIALFAALSIAFSSSSRQSTSFITDEEAKAYANQIIAYGNSVRQAVQKLMIRGCSNTEVSFANSIQSGHADSTAGEQCHIFSPNGGGLTYQLQNPKSNTSTPYHTHYIINSSNVWRDKASNQTIGNFAADLVFLAEINADVCQKINEALGNTPSFPPIIDDNGWNNNKGTRFSGSYITAAGAQAYPKHVKSGCIQYGGSGTQLNKYFYYKYLIIN